MINYWNLSIIWTCQLMEMSIYLKVSIIGKYKLFDQLFEIINYLNVSIIWNCQLLDMINYVMCKDICYICYMLYVACYVYRYIALLQCLIVCIVFQYLHCEKLKIVFEIYNMCDVFFENALAKNIKLEPAKPFSKIS